MISLTKLDKSVVSMDKSAPLRKSKWLLTGSELLIKFSMFKKDSLGGAGAVGVWADADVEDGADAGADADAGAGTGTVC